MVRRFAGLVLLTLIAGLSTAQEPAKVDLVWKFTKDKAFYQEMTTKTTQGINVSGQDLSQIQDQTFYFKWVPIKQDGDKWVLEQTIEGVKMKIDIAGNPISYDSTAPNAAGNTVLAEFFKALVGAKFTITLDKAMKVEKVDGREDFLKKLSSSNQAMEPLLKKILTDDAVKQMADPSFNLNKPGVKVGDTWDVPVKLNLGPIGTYDTKYTYTFKGPEKAGADQQLIEVKSSLTYTPPAAAEDGALPFKIKAADLKSKETEPGKILFNPKTGMVELTELKVKLAGTLTVEISGSTTTATLNQEQSTVVKTAEKSFLPEKK